jgi:hypothetical protein
MRRIALAICALMAAPATAAAQIAWETPQLTSPHTPRGMSVIAVKSAVAPGDGWVGMLMWRRTDGPGIGLRAGLGTGRGEDIAVGAGIDASAWVKRASASFPLDVVWMTGIGGSYGHSAQIALPIGISAGRSIGDDAFWFAPYASSRLIIEGRFGGSAPADEFDLQIANEVGTNMAFDRNRKFVLRAAASIGDRAALAIGGHVGAGALARPANQAMR